MFLYVNNVVWWPRVHAYIDSVDFVCFSWNHRPYCEWQASVSAHDEIKIISLFVCCCCSCCCWWFFFLSGLEKWTNCKKKKSVIMSWYVLYIRIYEVKNDKPKMETHFASERSCIQFGVCVWERPATKIVTMNPIEIDADWKTIFILHTLYLMAACALLSIDFCLDGWIWYCVFFFKKINKQTNKQRELGQGTEKRESENVSKFLFFSSVFSLLFHSRCVYVCV